MTGEPSFETEAEKELWIREQVRRAHQEAELEGDLSTARGLDLNDLIMKLDLLEARVTDLEEALEAVLIALEELGRDVKLKKA